MKCLLVLLVLISSNAFSKDESFLIKDPNFNGVILSRDSDLNGICKALGYEKSVPGAVSYESGSRNLRLVLHVLADGSVSHGSTYTRSIEKLICLNKVEEVEYNSRLKEGVLLSKFEEFSVIEFPKEPESKLNYFWKSDSLSVCTALGYEDSVAGAVVPEINMKESRDRIVVTNNKERTFNRFVDKSDEFGAIKQIVCRKSRGDFSREKKELDINNRSFIIVNPTLGDGIQISTKSVTDGVCKALGYVIANNESVETKSSESSDKLSIVINKKGKIFDTVPSDSIITKITCIKKIYENYFENEKGVFQETISLVKPTHSNSGSYFLSGSSFHGVCKSNKYDGAATLKGIITDDNLIGDFEYMPIKSGIFLKVDFNENITASKSTEEDDGNSIYVLKRIICMNELKPYPVQ